MAKRELTEEQRAEAYQEARREIEEVAVSGADVLRLNRQATRALTVLPPEIADLDKLKTLVLDNTRVSDLRRLEGLSGLQELTLNNTRVSDLRALQGLSGLQVLRLNNTQVSDLRALQRLSGLQFLSLDNTRVSDLRGLEGLSGLQALTLNNTQVSDLGPLADHATLQCLYVNNTRIADLRPLLSMPRIREAPEKNEVPYGVFFRNTPAAKADPEMVRISGIGNDKERTLALLDYLETLGPVEPSDVSEPLPDLEDVFQDQGGFQFALSATFPAFRVATGSVAAPAAAGQLLPRLRTRVAQALVAYDGAEENPAALILSDLQEMDRIVTCPLDGVADEALALWELSVGLASYLDEDNAALNAMVNYPTLGEKRRGVLRRLVNSSAIFVRMFPDALALDESHKDFLLNASRECLPSQITELAQVYALLEARSIDLIQAVEEIAKRSGPQGEKAEAVSTKGSRNLIAVVVAFAMGAAANGFFEDFGAELNQEMELSLRAAHFIRDARDEVSAFVADAPEDLRQAVEAAIEAVTGPDLPPLPPVKPVR